ncbi:FMN-dependent dehydrogenase superfamily [Methylophaga thiooxydans DMS010]|uniref:FMN-dependent dehydrogenase superfamily n=2 Tax=Methylophaga thiooxydans TaxID=392484 RepID=C0N4Y5_9GAMM|nr:FMN-dependent dehydrogenase superfamily [Methylophaga thiooxydans DMS010]
MSMQYVPFLDAIPQDLVSASDYARYAKEHLPQAIYEYLVGGGADEITLNRNRQKLDEILINPSLLQDCTNGGTDTVCLGEKFRHPLLLAPVAFQQLAHPDGEIATAQAADLLETGMIVSTLATQPLEDIAENLTQPKWFQLYIQQSRDFTLSLVQRAEKAGYTKLVVTIDAPLHGIRNRAQRAGFVLPEGISAVNLKDRPPLPRQSFDPSQSVVFQGMMSEAPTWDDIAWLQQQTSLPIILKGVLSVDDAIKAKAMGIAGIVVSNHGGRTLDCLPASIEMLPLIRQAVGPDYPLVFDGAVERGTDIFKALALGANLVCVGRPQFYALAVAGALGVAHLLRVLREELEVCMSLAGTPQIADIHADKLWRP